MRRSPLVLLLLVLAAPAWGQERRLGPDAAQLAARRELQSQLRARLQVWWDPSTGCPGSVRFEPPLPIRDAQAPETAARLLLRRLEPLWGGRLPLDEQRERRGPHLVHAETRAAGPFRRVVFRQMLGPIPVDGSELTVTVGRREGACLVTEVAGRAFRDAPWAVALPACARRADEAPVLTLIGERWQVLLRRVAENADGLPEELWRDGRGALVRRRLLADAGTAEATVSGRRFPASGLYVDTGGSLALTEPGGTFPGLMASLPAGLSGPLLRILPGTTRPYPSTRTGSLVLAFPDGDPRAEELSVWFGLRRTHDFYRRIPGVGAGDADRPILVRLRDGVVNAYAASRPAQAEGRSYDATLVFGYRMTEDSVVSHERGHAFLNHLGFTSGSGDFEQRALHEALADYLAAAQLGSSLIAPETLGDARRNIDDDLVYPRDLGSSAHRAGVIFSGAVWDLRREVGRAAPEVDAALVRTVRALVNGVTMPRAAQVLAGELPEGRLREAGERHLRAHGLLPSPEEGPLGMEVSWPDGGSWVEVAAGQRVVVTVRAWDPGDASPEPGQEPSSSVEVLISPLAWASSQARTQTALGGPPERRVELTLAPPAGTAGSFQLTLAATSRRTGRMTARTLPVRVIPAPFPETPWTQLPPLELRVRVGERREERLEAMFPGLPAGRARFELSGPNSTATGNRDLAASQLTASVAVVGSTLHVAPEPGEEGVHLFQVNAEPDEPGRQVTRVHVRPVRLVVEGADPGRVHAFEATQPSGGFPGHALIPPGGQVTVVRGSAARLHLLGEGAPGPLALRLAPRSPATASLAAVGSSPTTVTAALPLLLPAGSPQGATDQARADLTVTPAAEGPPEVIEVTVQLVRTGAQEGEPAGAVLASRKLRIVVQPAAVPSSAQEPPLTPPGPEGTPSTKGLVGALEAE